jgi:hypothetical protein
MIAGYHVSDTIMHKPLARHAIPVADGSRGYDKNQDGNGRNDQG